MSMLGSLPFGPCDFGLDHLSAFFLLPVFIISTCCSIYGTCYWPAAANAKTYRKLTFFFGILTAALIILITAKNSILFLLAWETMALSAFFVLTTEDHKQDVQDAGLIYLIATHTGTLALFAMFSLLGFAASSYQFSAMATISPSAPIAVGNFLHRPFRLRLESRTDAAARLAASGTCFRTQSHFRHHVRGHDKNRCLWHTAGSFFFSPPTPLVGHDIAGCRDHFSRDGGNIRPRTA